MWFDTVITSIDNELKFNSLQSPSGFNPPKSELKFTKPYFSPDSYICYYTAERNFRNELDEYYIEHQEYHQDLGDDGSILMNKCCGLHTTYHIVNRSYGIDVSFTDVAVASIAQKRFMYKGFKYFNYDYDLYMKKTGLPAQVSLVDDLLTYFTKEEWVTMAVEKYNFCNMLDFVELFSDTNGCFCICVNNHVFPVVDHSIPESEMGRADPVIAIFYPESDEELFKDALEMIDLEYA